MLSPTSQIHHKTNLAAFDKSTCDLWTSPTPVLQSGLNALATVVTALRKLYSRSYPLQYSMRNWQELSGSTVLNPELSTSKKSIRSGTFKSYLAVEISEELLPPVARSNLVVSDARTKMAGRAEARNP
jgi:hypothetical protein